MITSIASQKGGTGKTTTSISLAAGLARRGDRVLLIDVDSQANSSKVLIPDYPQIRKDDTIYATIMERHPLPVGHTTVENLDIVASHILLSNTDVELTTAKDHREARLKRELDRIKDRYDHAIIDCPPTLSWLTLNAFTASDWVIVVVSPGYFELDSITQITKTIFGVQDIFNPNLQLRGYLFIPAPFDYAAIDSGVAVGRAANASSSHVQPASRRTRAGSASHSWRIASTAAILSSSAAYTFPSIRPRSASNRRSAGLSSGA